MYEYATSLDCILLHFAITGFTASGMKLILASPKVVVIGSVISAEGWHLEHGIANKILNWPQPQSLMQVRGFLGVAGVGRRWVKNFSLIAKPLTALCRITDFADVEFHFPQEAQNAMDELK